MNVSARTRHPDIVWIWQMRMGKMAHSEVLSASETKSWQMLIGKDVGFRGVLSASDYSETWEKDGEF